MSIDPDAIYYSLRFFIDEIEKWKIDGPLQGDLAAGLVLGLCLMLDFEARERYIVLLQSDARLTTIPLSEYYKEGLYIFWDSIFSAYSAQSEHAATILDHPKRVIRGIGRKFRIRTQFIWNIVNLPYFYAQKYDLDYDDLMTTYIPMIFRNVEFIRGFISMMNAFRVDFRDYVLGPPFRFDNDIQALTFYQIEGYDIVLPEDDLRYK